MLTAAPMSKDIQWSWWLNAWTVLSLPTVCAAILSWGAMTVASIAATMAVPVVLFVMVNADSVAPQAGASLRAAWAGRVALCAAMLTVSVSAIAHEIPVLAVIIVMAACLTSSPVVAWCRRLLPAQDRMGPAMSGSPVIPDDDSQGLPPSLMAARTMSEAELCRAWRRSFWSLLETSHPMDKLELVQERHFLLDELETRNAVALRAWLDSGARPCVSPERFFTDGPDGRDQAP